MEDLELLARAQNYVEKMANGINPLDGSVIEDDSVLNNVRVSRCLFYVSGILKEIIAKGGLTKKNKSKAFVYDAIKASTVKIDARPIALSEIIRNIKDVFTDCKVPTFRQMAELLKAKGILIDNPEKGGTHYVASPQAAVNGVWTEIAANGTGKEYWRTLYDENGPLYENYGYYTSLVAGYNSTYGTFHSWERGGIDEYDFNVSFNINDRFYLGVTFGAYDVSYDKHTFYDEDYGSGEGYFLESFNRIHGSGFDVKLGTIFRPIEASPLRIGLSVHTPIFYRLTYATGAYIQSDVYVDDDQSTTGLYVDTYEQLGNRDMEFDFRLQTPWVVNASVGYTVGNNLALGAEYEFENFSNMKFKDVNNYDMDPETDEVKYTLKGVHTFRLGAEYKPISAFAFRVGYNYSSTAYKADAYKNIFSNSVSTDTEYSNDKSRNTFTVGIGYRGSLFYADLAYKYDMYKSDFYPFYNNLEGVKMAATKVSNTRSQVLLTLGCRF